MDVGVVLQRCALATARKQRLFDARAWIGEWPLSYESIILLPTARSIFPDYRSYVRSRDASGLRGSEQLMEIEMGKYVLAWLLGVPAFVLVLVYLVAH